MSKLTKRESILINALLLVVVVGMGFRFWIAPLMEEIKVLENEKQVLTSEKTSLDFVLANKESVEKKLNDLTSEYELSKENFSSDLTNLMITNFAKNSGLEVTNISRGEVTIKKIQTASASLNQYDYDIYNLIQQIEAGEVPEVIDESTTSDFAYQEIQINLVGDRCECQSFIDNLNQSIKTGYITSFVFDQSAQQVQITLGVYSLLPLESNY